MLDDDDIIFKAISKGANGYLTKGYSLDEFEQKIIDILEGKEGLVSAVVAKKMVAYFQQISRPTENAVKLTDLEKTTARYLSDGLSYEEIGNKMGVSVNGVRYHIKNIYGKLNINSRYQLINWLKGDVSG